MDININGMRRDLEQIMEEANDAIQLLERGGSENVERAFMHIDRIRSLADWLWCFNRVDSRQFKLFI